MIYMKEIVYELPDDMYEDAWKQLNNMKLQT